MSDVPLKIHHINLVVPDLDVAARQFSTVLGIDASAPECLEARAVRLTRFELDGVWLVLVAPTADDSPAAQWLDAHGPGLFLLSFETSDLLARLDQLMENGIAGRGAPRLGLDDWQVADLELEAFFGIPLQLTQRLNRTDNGE